MAIKLKSLQNQSGSIDTYIFFCPACQCVHPYTVPRWSFNGDMERPTFNPSLRVGKREGSGMETACHLFLENGLIRYCGDCPHGMAGKSIECPDWHDDLW